LPLLVAVCPRQISHGKILIVVIWRACDFGPLLLTIHGSRSVNRLISVKRLFFTKGIVMISGTCTYFLCMFSVFTEKPLCAYGVVSLKWSRKQAAGRPIAPDCTQWC